MPPHLAGREEEMGEFKRLLQQQTILENMVLTGLRGVGKTVLLEKFKPIALESGWNWAGTDLSESASVNEEVFALRLLTDLSAITSHVVLEKRVVSGVGFVSDSFCVEQRLGYDALVSFFNQAPGLVADKLKAVLEFVWERLQQEGSRGVVFAYDEAQNMADRPDRDQYPLAMLLDVFQSIQRKGIPFMLVLTGLPTLFPKLVEARTFAERMFRVVLLGRLNEVESRDAILTPLKSEHGDLVFTKASVQMIVRDSGGYPYFIQFICREAYDAIVQAKAADREPSVPMPSVMRKLDADFFEGRWAKATDRQRELLWVIARLRGSDEEFTVQEVVEQSKSLLEKPFSSSHANQMLSSMGNAGLVYKNRHGKYSFAVPLFGQFILRQENAIVGAKE